MNATELADLSLTDAAALLERREVSPVDLTEACIARADALEDRIHAFITKTFDSARDEARAATEEIGAGRRRGPLHGIPFALKDLYATAGVRTTAGSQARKDFVPTSDATAVTKLKEAGVVSLGKLNMHEFALGGTNIQTFFPTPSNPWGLDRVTGGSSGGSGAAVAAGFCLGSLGSDTRGSIRVPSALCGITGLKPTYGRVSLKDVVPLIWSMDHAGPMARTAADCAAILGAIAGYDPADPTSADVPVPDYLSVLGDGIAGVRIGVPRNFFFDEGMVGPEVAKAVHATEEVLTSLGAKLTAVDFPDPAAYSDNGAFLAEAAAYHEAELAEHGDLYGPIGERLEGAKNISAMEYSRARFKQRAFKQAVGHLFREIDLIAFPTTPVVATPIAESGTIAVSQLLLRHTGPFNLVGVPVITVPCGFSSEGLPIGLSIAGRAWEEALVLRAGHAFQEATQWHKRRPAIANQVDTHIQPPIH